MYVDVNSFNKFSSPFFAYTLKNPVELLAATSQGFFCPMICASLGNAKAQIIAFPLICGANICLRISFKMLYDQADFIV